MKIVDQKSINGFPEGFTSNLARQSSSNPYFQIGHSKHCWQGLKVRAPKWCQRCTDTQVSARLEFQNTGEEVSLPVSSSQCLNRNLPPTCSLHCPLLLSPACLCPALLSADPFSLPLACSQTDISIPAAIQSSTVSSFGQIMMMLSPCSTARAQLLSPQDASWSPGDIVSVHIAILQDKLIIFKLLYSPWKIISSSVRAGNYLTPLNYANSTLNSID